MIDEAWNDVSHKFSNVLVFYRLDIVLNHLERPQSGRCLCNSGIGSLGDVKEKSFYFSEVILLHQRQHF